MTQRVMGLFWHRSVAIKFFPMLSRGCKLPGTSSSLSPNASARNRTRAWSHPPLAMYVNHCSYQRSRFSDHFIALVKLGLLNSSEDNLSYSLHKTNIWIFQRTLTSLWYQWQGLLIDNYFYWCLCGSFTYIYLFVFYDLVIHSIYALFVSILIFLHLSKLFGGVIESILFQIHNEQHIITGHSWAKVRSILTSLLPRRCTRGFLLALQEELDVRAQFHAHRDCQWVLARVAEL